MPRAFSHDALGHLVADGEVAYEWDSHGRVAGRSEAGEAAVFVYSGDDLDPMVVGDHERGTGSDGRPVSVDDEVVTIDGHGDIVAATGPDRAPFGHNAATPTWYSPWGTPAVIDDVTGTGAGPFGFQGDYTDPTTGTVWMGARTYDPTTATFTSRDTWPGTPDHPVTLNRYTYANTNPIDNWDPTGHRTQAYVDAAEVTAATGVLRVVLPLLWGFARAASRAVVSVLAVAGLMIVAAEALVILLNHRTQGLTEPGVDDPTPPTLDPEPPDPLRPTLGSPCTTSAGASGVIDDFGNCVPFGETDPGLDPPNHPDPGVEPDPGGSSERPPTSSGPPFNNRWPETAYQNAGPFPDLTKPLAWSGTYLWVVIDGVLIVAKARPSRNISHADVAGGRPVDAAGEMTTSGGKITEVNNKSGHYCPSGPQARSNAIEAFRRAGQEIEDAYREYEI